MTIIFRFVVESLSPFLGDVVDLKIVIFRLICYFLFPCMWSCACSFSSSRFFFFWLPS